MVVTTSVYGVELLEIFFCKCPTTHRPQRPSAEVVLKTSADAVSGRHTYLQVLLALTFENCWKGI